MRATPKEILNNKSNRMIDLILDEIRTGGSKTITAGFTHEKEDKNYILTVGITVAPVEKEEDILEDVCANCSCNPSCHPSADTPAEDTPTNTDTPAEDTPTNTDTPAENTGEQQNP